MSAGWNYLLLNGLSPGTGAGNRVGREVYMDYIQWYLSSITRFMIVYDRQSNGAVPSSTALTEDSTDQFSPWAYDGKDRFDILWDSQFDVTPEYSRIQVQKAMPVNRTAYYNAGTAGTVADITTGALYLAWWSAGASAGPNISLMLYFRE